MASWLLDAAQARWRRFNGHELIADVLAGVTCKDGECVIDVDNDNIHEKVAATPPTARVRLAGGPGARCLLSASRQAAALYLSRFRPVVVCAA